MALWLQSGSSCIVFQSLPMLKKYLNSLLMILLLHFHKSLLSTRKRKGDKGRENYLELSNRAPNTFHATFTFTFFKPIIRVCSNTSLATLATLQPPLPSLSSSSPSLAAMKPSCGKTLNYFRRAAHKSVKCPATPTPKQGWVHKQLTN